jgi:hypothetical protein
VRAWHLLNEALHELATAILRAWGFGGVEPMECGARYVFRVAGEEDARVYYCSQPIGHSGAHVELELMWPQEEAS